MYCTESRGRELPIRGVILISAAGFGAVHLIGLLSELHPAVVLAQAYAAFALGLIFAGARARDVSIVVPIFAHTVFDFLALSAQGTVTQMFENVPQVVGGMLFSGTIALVWGLWLLWKAKGLAERRLDEQQSSDQASAAAGA